jgi:ABC-2 type transport system ATP-binding protein
MVDGRIEAMGTPAALKRQFDVATLDELFVRLARPAGPAARPIASAPG